MMKYLTIFLLLATAFIGCNSSSTRDLKGDKTLNDSAYMGNRNGGRIVTRPYYIPLPVDFLYEIQNYDFATSWGIVLYTYDISQPSKRLSINVVYYTFDDRLEGGGYYPGKYQDPNFAYSFPSSRDFFNFITYLQQHPDIFFNYTEFEGAPPGEIVFPEGMDEYFTLGVTHAPNGEDQNYKIGKCIIAGEENPPEIVYAIDYLKTNFRDVILQHPSYWP